MQDQEEIQQAMGANAPPTGQVQFPQMASIERGTGELSGDAEPAGHERTALSSTRLLRSLCDIQLGRVKKLLALENLMLSPLPNLWHEIQLLVTIADSLRKAEVGEWWLEPKGTSPTKLNSGEIILAEKTGGQPSEVKEVQELDVMDRHLVRQAAERMLRIREQGKEVVDASAEVEPDRNGKDRTAQ